MNEKLVNLLAQKWDLNKAMCSVRFSSTSIHSLQRAQNPPPPPPPRPPPPPPRYLLTNPSHYWLPTDF